MAAEHARVAELVVAWGDWERHREVVALAKPEQNVLHSTAGCLVCLEEDHIGVFDSSLMRAYGWAVESEYFHGPVGTENYQYLCMSVA